MADKQNFLDEAWQIARAVAEVDKQLLSSGAVGAFARLADLASQSAARRCAEIAEGYVDWEASIAVKAVAHGIAAAIRSEFEERE